MILCLSVTLPKSRRCLRPLLPGNGSIWTDVRGARRPSALSKKSGISRFSWSKTSLLTRSRTYNYALPRLRNGLCCHTSSGRRELQAPHGRFPGNDRAWLGGKRRECFTGNHIRCRSRTASVPRSHRVASLFRPRGARTSRCVYLDRIENAGHVELLGSLLDLQGARVLEVRSRPGRS